ncbi:hypothetical protein QJQ45_014268, partial [Haematococcus lacustris]
EDLPASQYCQQQPDASLAPGVGLANAASVSRAAERLEAELLGSEAEEEEEDYSGGRVARGGISKLTQELNMAELQCYLGTIGQSKQGRKLDLINRVAQHPGLADGFNVGTIKQVRVHDFMTYVGTVTITPGPSLNLVLGPNGSGKSSFVCALCVGLGGSTKLLGRADNLASFVRRNCNKAWTEITLSGGAGQPDIVIRRDISITYSRGEDGRPKQGYEAQFQINGVNRLVQDVLKQVRSLNIQMDNLCQFLPQDKVAEFAKMDAYELLIATEKAMGDCQMYNQHQKLIADRIAVKELQQAMRASTLCMRLTAGCIGAPHATQLSSPALRPISDARAALAQAVLRWAECLQTRQRDANKVQQLKAQQEADGREYQRYMQREKLREEAKLATIKLLWLDFKEAAEVFKVREREYKEAKDALVRCMKEEEQEAAPSQELDGREAELKRQREVAKKAVVTEQTKAQRQMEEWDKARGKLEDIIDQLTRLQEKSTARARTLLQLKANIAATEQQLAQQPTGISAEKQERHRQLRLEHNTAEQEARYAKEQIQLVQEQVHAKQEQIRRLDIHLEQLNNRRLQRLRQCESANRHRNQGLTDVVAFIEAQKLAGKFKGPVYGPVAIELEVKDMGNNSIAGYVEQQCWSGLFNFVVKYREDEELISSFIRSSRLSFTVAAVGKNETEPIHHPCGDPSQLGQFGISHTLDQVIEAPSLVKHMLADLCGINRAYIGNANTQARSDQLFNTTDVRMVYTPSVKLTFSRSYYNAQQTNNQQDGVRTNCSVLGGLSVAGLEAEKLKAQTEKAAYVAEHAALLIQMRDQETLMQAHRANADRALKGLGEIDMERKRIGEIAARLGNELGTQRRQLKSEEAKPDPLNQQEPLRKEQQAILDALVKLAGQQVQVQHELWVKQQGLAALELALKETECQMSALRHSYNECKQATERARAKCDQARNAMNEAKEDKEWVSGQQASSNPAFHTAIPLAHENCDTGLRKMGVASPVALLPASYKAHLCTSAPIPTRDARQEAEEQLPVGEVEAKLGHLPSSREELERWRRDKEAQAAELVCANAGIMHEYQRRQQDLEAKTVELAELTAREERAEAELARQDAAWRPALQGLVDTINTSFGRNFAEIGCVGEVVLTDHADYDKFAITIRVSFREGEELHALTGTRQSGGERSVSTILYLIALQAVTHTPFRVVDEINQGMDPINERKVFIQLVESSCKPGTPQCFLLTPKLLPGLPFTPEITVLTIMNGAHIDRTAVAAYNKQEGLYGARWTAAAAAQHTTQRWLAPIKPHLQHLAAASSAGPSLEANLKHLTVTLATWDAVWEVYLDPKWARQWLRLYGAQERALEQFFKELEEEMAELSIKRHNRAKQLAALAPGEVP